MNCQKNDEKARIKLKLKTQNNPIQVNFQFDKNLLNEPDNNLVEPDSNLVEPDNYLVEPNNNLVEPDYTNKSKQGYIYVIYNPVYEFYGEHTYKIGRTKNIQNRLNSYVTSYIDDPIIVYQSPLLWDYVLAESTVFKKLTTNRIKKNREFFRSDIDTVKKIIDEVSDLIINCCDCDKIHQFINTYLMSMTDENNEASKIKEIDSLCYSNIERKEEYDKLIQKAQDQLLNLQENNLLLKCHIHTLYQLDVNMIIEHPFVAKYMSRKAINQYINRCRLNYSDLNGKISEFIGAKFDQNTNMMNNFDEKHKHFNLLLCCLFLCEILGVKSLTQMDIKKWTITGKQLYDRWVRYIGDIADKIEIWTFTLRKNINKIIKKDTCLQWNNKKFLEFINSLCSVNLGIHIKAIKKNGKDSKKTTYNIVDIFDENNSPKLRQLAINDESSMLPKFLGLS